MTYRSILLATTITWSLPALAVVDPPAASSADNRMRVVVHDPNNPVQIYAAPGMSLRLQLGDDETVTAVIVSDQGTIAPGVEEIPQQSANSSTLLGSSEAHIPPSCDANLCRSVVGNFVYLKPLRSLDPQPLFIQTTRTNAYGRAENTPYSFELLTRPSDASGDATMLVAAGSTVPAKSSPAIWGVRFVYPDREKAAKAVAWANGQRQREAEARDRASLARSDPMIAGPGANWRYGYRGAASVQPDLAWDDGRTTFLRYNGNRRVPNVYSRLPDGHESIPANAPEPDATGNTLRIAHTESKWWIRDGDEAGCLFDLGPDPEGATAPTVIPGVRASQ